MAGQQPQSGGAVPAAQSPTPSYRQGWQAQGVQYAGARGQGGAPVGQPGLVGAQMQPAPAGQAAGMQQPTVFEDALSNPTRWALYDLHKTVQQCRWCADQCLQEGPQMATVAGVVGDLADLAEVNERLIARQSPFGPAMAQAFVQAAQSADQRLANHPSSHVQGTRRTVQRAIDSTSRALQAVGQGPAGAGRPEPQPARPGATAQQSAAGSPGAGRHWAVQTPEAGLGAPTLPLPPP